MTTVAAPSPSRKSDEGEMRRIGRWVTWIGLSLALLSPLVAAAFLLAGGSPAEVWRGSAGPRALGRAVLLQGLVAILSVALAGVGLAAAGWGIRSVATAHRVLARAEASINSYALAERERVRRFESLYGRLFEEIERTRRVFSRAYVAVPGPRGTVVKAPIEIGDRGIISPEIGTRVPGTPLERVWWIAQPARERLLDAGVLTLRDLALEDAARLSRKTGLPESDAHQWIRVGRLFSLEGMTEAWALALVDAGVTSVADLASRNASTLALLAANSACLGLPADDCAARIQAFIDAARKMWNGIETNSD